MITQGPSPDDTLKALEAKKAAAHRALDEAQRTLDQLSRVIARKPGGGQRKIAATTSASAYFISLIQATKSESEILWVGEVAWIPLGMALHSFARPKPPGQLCDHSPSACANSNPH